MKHAIFAAAAVCSICMTAFAQDRLTDRDVKALVARIEDGRDKFDDALDSDLKNKVLRGPNGEVNVKNFLDDFQPVFRLEQHPEPLARERLVIGDQHTDARTAWIAHATRAAASVGMAERCIGSAMRTVRPPSPSENSSFCASP